MSLLKILIIGGAGYIGSHMVKRLGQLGWAPQFPDLETIVAHAWGWEQKTIGENV